MQARTSCTPVPLYPCAGENCYLRRCVVDENASIGNNVQVGGSAAPAPAGLCPLALPCLHHCLHACRGSRLLAALAAVRHEEHRPSPAAGMPQLAHLPTRCSLHPACLPASILLQTTHLQTAMFWPCLQIINKSGLKEADRSEDSERALPSPFCAAALPCCSTRRPGLGSRPGGHRIGSLPGMHVHTQ